MKSITFLILFSVFIIQCQESKPQDQNANSNEELVDTIPPTETKTETNETPIPIDAPVIIPRDEIDKDPSLKAAVARLEKVVEEKDTEGLVSFISEDMLASFGGEKGIKQFKILWNLEKNPKKSFVWQELKWVLELGGVFADDENYTMPYLFLQFPQEYDPFEYYVITGKNVRMRSEPNSESEIIGSVSYEIVKINSEGQDEREEEINGEIHPWVEIIRRNEQKGYVYGKYVRSPIDYRLNLKKINGEWKMTFFVAGD